MSAGIFDHVVAVASAPDPDTCVLGGEYVMTVGAAPPAAAAPAASYAASPARATVGGVDYAIGGWGAYEIDRRNARWVHGGGGPAERPGARYAGRTYIHAEDAVESLVAGAKAATGRPAGRGALQQAARRLADVLGRLEDILCEPDEDGVWECQTAWFRQARGEHDSLTIPAVTSADLRSFADDPIQEADPEAMYELAVSVATMVAASGEVLPALPPLAAGSALPALPSRAVPIDDDAAVLQLEADTGPYLRTLEDLQAVLAARLNTAADLLTKAGPPKLK
jgi:hypothetical protein